MVKYYHAHQVVEDKCQGHMSCMRNCPTEAIRIRGGKAQISEELCVDCGNCITVCPSGAIIPITDPVAESNHYQYSVVVPDPVLYTQFDSSIHPYVIHLAFKELGFDRVVDVNTSAAAIGKAVARYISQYEGRLPLISSHCPAVLRLIQVRYPDLVELISPIDVPREVTAREIRRTLPAELGLKPEEIGITFVAPCPSKIVSIKQPAEKSTSWFDGAVSITDIFPSLYARVKEITKHFDDSQVPEDFIFNTGWAMLGSITASTEMESWLAVSGLSHVMRIFDDIENSRLSNVDFIEAQSCMLGCIGGTFYVENPYVARTNNIKQTAKYQTNITIENGDFEGKMEEGYFFMENPVPPRPTKYFDTDLQTSILRMKEKERIYQKLMQIDCGLCGAPTCMAFAEDVVRGESVLTDCVFLGGEAPINKHILAVDKKQKEDPG